MPKKIIIQMTKPHQSISTKQENHHTNQASQYQRRQYSRASSILRCNRSQLLHIIGGRTCRICGIPPRLGRQGSLNISKVISDEVHSQDTERRHLSDLSTISSTTPCDVRTYLLPHSRRPIPDVRIPSSSTHPAIITTVTLSHSSLCRFL